MNKLKEHISNFKNFTQKLNEDHWPGAISEVIYDTKDCKLIHCINHIATMEYGVGTKWEFSKPNETESKKSFNSYKNKGWSFYILLCYNDFDKDVIEARYAIAVSPQGLFFVYDENDNEMDEKEYPKFIINAIRKISKNEIGEIQKKYAGPDRFEKLSKNVYSGLSEKKSERLIKENTNKKLDTYIKELTIGIKEEMEHTDDFFESTKIAMDHLKEDEKYYTKLKKAGL